MSHRKLKEPWDWESVTPLKNEALENKTNQYEEDQEIERLIKKDSHPCGVFSDQ